jgi:hypothetical protein
MAGAGTRLITKIMVEAGISHEKITESLGNGVDNRWLEMFADPEEHDGLYEDLCPPLVREEVKRIIELVTSEGPEGGVGGQAKLMLAEEPYLHDDGSYATSAEKERIKEATAKMHKDADVYATAAAAADAAAAAEAKAAVADATAAPASAGSLYRQLTRHTTQPEPETASGGGKGRRKSKKKKSKKKKSKKKKTRRRRTRRR